MANLRFAALIYAAAKEFQADNASRLAAALAYYTVFSLAPLLVVCIALAGRVLGEQAVQGELVAEISAVTGEDTALFIQQLIAQSSGTRRTGVAALTAFAVLLYGATRVFVQLKDALNVVWGVSPPDAPVVWSFVRDRLLSFMVVLMIGFLLLAALVANAATGAALHWSASWITLPAPAFYLIGTGLSVLYTALLCALIFKILPDRVIPWRDVWIGAAAVGVLYACAQTLLGLYFASGAIASTYGAAASVIVILVWVNLAAQIFLFGAELIKVSGAQRKRR